MQTAVCGTSKHTLGWNIIEQKWSIGISVLLIVIILDTFGTLKQLIKSLPMITSYNSSPKNTCVVCSDSGSLGQSNHLWHHSGEAVKR